jgi:predicted NBD/HSP70 family sugar kinase
LMQARGWSGSVPDVGASKMKLDAPGRCWTFRRDLNRLPDVIQVSPAEAATQRRRLREFIALKLQMAMAETGRRPQAMVFALPARVAVDGTPGHSNYAGMQGDVGLLPDALQMAGLANVPLLVLHDVELAALGALSDPRLAGFRKILVLALGSGIGAALINRAS